MRSTTRPALQRALAALAVLGVFAGAMAGCNIVAPIVLLVAGPPTFEKEFDLDSDRPTVVFIDDPRSQLPRRALRIELLNAAQDDILRKSLVKDLIDGQAAVRVADADSTGGQMSVTELGRTIGAEVVIWVTVDQFVRPDTTGDVQPIVSIRVRVIDAEEDTLLYPKSPTGRAVRVTDAVRRGAVANAAGARSAAEIAIVQKVGKAAAQLFYEHPVTEHVADRGL